MALLGPVVLRERTGIRDHRDHKDPPDPEALKALRARSDLQDLRVSRERRALSAMRATLDLWGLQESPGLLSPTVSAPPDPLALQVQRVLLVLWALKVSEALKEEGLPPAPLCFG